MLSRVSWATSVGAALVCVDVPRLAADAPRPLPFPASSSWADSVLSYNPGYGGGCEASHPNFVDPTAALGPDDYSGGPAGTGAVALGSGGLIELRLTPAIANSGDARLDLRIMEVGGFDEACFVALRPAPPLTAQDMANVGLQDRNGDGFYEIKRIGGGASYIDLDARFTTPVAPQALHFDAVQITDDLEDHGACTTTSGADIDAVEAMDPFVAVEPGNWSRVKLLYRD
jgi:hypothetical protein